MPAKARPSALRPGGVDVEVGRGCPDEHDRLSERDDDEQLEALGEVGGLDVPCLGSELRTTRDAVEEHRRDVVDCERDQPESGPRLVLDERARDPERPGRGEPDEDRQRPFALDRPRPRGREGQEQVPTHLDGDVRAGEQETPRPERVRNGYCHHERREHDPHQQQADNRRVRIELVRHPCGVVPRPPDDEQDECRLAGAPPREVVEQQVRHLRDGEHEDEVVEELERRRPLLLPRVAVALEARRCSRRAQRGRNRARASGAAMIGSRASPPITAVTAPRRGPQTM